VSREEDVDALPFLQQNYGDYAQRPGPVYGLKEISNGKEWVLPFLTSLAIQFHHPVLGAMVVSWRAQLYGMARPLARYNGRTKRRLPQVPLLRWA